MNKKNVLLVLLIILTLFSSPIYSQGYESPNIFKLGFQLIFYLVVFIAVIFIALYGTRLVAKNAKGMSDSKYIKLMDAINIPGGSKIVITKINNKIYILSANNNGMSVIDIIEKEEFTMNEEDFENYLDKYLNKNQISIDKIKERVESFLNKPKRIKLKEEEKDEKQN